MKEPITFGQLQWLSSAVVSGIVPYKDYSGLSKQEAHIVIKNAEYKFKEDLKKRNERKRGTK